ncbi:hypothetical protein F7Q93_19755 [Brucella pituitosa]|uniref:Uncharacterized protein n=1 Tax=Brucella pituitosa TaxID=571256 RepID=A0A643EV00_9HYPH|nr:hypothetical protein F7Q93_19755 [Brucella pituitosa]
MVSRLFAGITRPLFQKTVMPKLLTQVPFLRSQSGRILIGMVTGFKLEYTAGKRRNPHPDRQRHLV